MLNHGECVQEKLNTQIWYHWPSMPWPAKVITVGIFFCMSHQLISIINLLRNICKGQNCLLIIFRYQPISLQDFWLPIEQPIRFRLSIVYTSLGLSNTEEGNSNVNMLTLQFDLRCESETGGRYTWSRVGGELPDDSATSGAYLRIYDFSAEDAGAYTCTVEGDGGATSSVTHSVRLNSVCILIYTQKVFISFNFPHFFYFSKKLVSPYF